jgi:hypothetical protein
LYKNDRDSLIGGWIKDRRNEKDYLLTAKRAVEIKESSDLSKYLPFVRNQGGQGSCVGHGIGGILTGKTIQKGIYTEWMSPRWIYYLGRFLGGYANEDCGTEPRLALDGLVKFGCLLESQWQYEERFNPSNPTIDMYIEALKKPLLFYSRVVDGVDGICTALSENNLVAIGSPWYSKWGSTDDNGKLKKPRCYNSVAGGHETFLYGHDYKTEYFNLQNSWGEDFGNEGRCLLPFSAIPCFKKHGGYDAHILEINWDKLGIITGG